jgi:integrase/recombinase XerD
MMVNEALTDFMRAARADGLRPATLKWYQSLLGQFTAHFKHCELTTITANDLRDYIIELRMKDTKYIDAPQKPAQDGGLSEATISGHITALHAFWVFCAEEYSIVNPMRNIKRPKRRQAVPRAIEDENFVRLFDATGDNDAGIRDRAMLAFFADSGCRLGGLLSITKEHLNIKEESAIVIEKGGHARTVNFTPITARLLHQWLAVRISDSEHVFTSVTTGAALTESGINQILKRLKKRAGVKGRCNPHSFRHAFARAYIKNGGSEGTLATILGNSIQIVHDTYAVFTNEEIKEFHHEHTPMKKLQKKIRGE